VTEAVWDDGLSGWFELAARHEGGHRVATWVPARPDLLDERGHMQLGAVTFAVDAAVGMSAGWTSVPDWVVTTDVDLRLFGPVTAGPVRAEATPVRRGRTQVLVEARAFDEGDGDRLVAAGSANHNMLPPDAGVMIDLLPVGEVHRQPPLPHATVPALREHFGLIERGPGVVETSMTDTTRNPWGILHGALHALLADHARRSIAPGDVTSMTVRFAGPVRVGPAVACAELVGERNGRAIIRAEVVDAGADNRLGSLTFFGVDLGA
jgi:acyl-coenzyme A thioesterase PaaI-like protein